MRKALLLLLIIAVLAAAGTAAWFVVKTNPNLSSNTSSPESYYSFDDEGLAFKYPTTYVFESYPLGDELYSWNSLMMIRATDKASAEANGASEGPVSINVGIFPNPEHVALEDWIQNSEHSNFGLSPDKKMTATTLGGEKAYSYSYSGLYENDVTIAAHGDSIYMFEVGWMDAGDTIRADFQNLLKTVTFK